MSLKKRYNIFLAWYYISMVKTNKTKGADKMKDKSKAIEILRQLGGSSFVSMTGAKNFGYEGASLSFKIPSSKYNYVKITLNSKDLYDVHFQRIMNKKFVPLVLREETIKDLYCDQLTDIFTDKTGLEVSL